MARTIWSLLVSSWPMNTSSWDSTDRTSPSRPPSALFSSVEMVLSWATPPPLSSRDSAPRTSSTSGFRPLCASGMVSPSPRRPLEAPLAGAASETNFSPSRLVCRIVASALSGSFTLLRSWTVTSAW